MFKLSAIPEIINKSIAIFPSLKEELETYTEIVSLRSKPMPLSLDKAKSQIKVIPVKKKTMEKVFFHPRFIKLFKILIVFISNTFIFSLFTLLKEHLLLWIICFSFGLTLLSWFFYQKVFPRLNF